MSVANERRSWLVPVSLLVRLLAIAWVPFPPTEGSLYYLDVARNLVQGHGLTTDALWSYANPPFSLPRPAFDLWLPLASLVAAVPMLIGGTAHQVGQLGGALLGACLAPLAWAVAREAAGVDGLDRRRSGAVALTAGLLAAVLGPFLVATVAPDSTVPFAVLGTLDALLIARLLRQPSGDGIRGGRRYWLPGLVLGLSLGLPPSPGEPSTATPGSTVTTNTPARPSSSAMAAPMPTAPPVTTATLTTRPPAPVRARSLRSRPSPATR